LGDTASIEVEAFPGKRFRGRVVEVGYSPVQGALANQVDQVTNYPVKVLIERESYLSDSVVMLGIPPHGSPFRPSMNAVVRIFTDRAENTLVVPTQCITLQKDETGTPTSSQPQRIVFGLQAATEAEGPNTVQAIPVTVGISDERGTQILTGLTEGQRVVTGPFSTISNDLRDGAEVVVQGAEASPGTR
jgi:HlyD family secretion protein